MTPDKNQNKEKLYRLKVIATTPEAKLIENPETLFPRKEAKAIDKAQEVMNDLYRKEAKYGDGSSAFMLIKEQFEGGVGNDLKSLTKKGEKEMFHDTKCNDYIIGLKNYLNSCHFSDEACNRIQYEIQKMEEAVQWAEDYKNGNDPKIPSWAKPWKHQLGE